ncbi:fatty acyl-CoA hydrolase precursor, medium chain-like isoform X2 [Ascaphus truei]|uniref:fatty acyl-CoA hydrolase precursor, medium chain-like isoform X2 n=1 Tax=Ascaphus truei TaxID=8439 RepID=UPI003F5A138E
MTNMCGEVTMYLHGNNDGNPLVTTKYGDLQGKMLKAEGTEKGVHAFLGIPFAKPPVGPLRFSAPQPAEPWNSVREASEQPPVCLQDKSALEVMKEFLRVEIELPPVSEDCLFLNVYTPADRKKESKLPVMAFIHGGGLTMGGAFMFPGTALSAHENVVIVGLQYRLGILGFFSTGDAKAPGNFGMLDQVAALQWVQENIEDFGGDPQSVTIFGESAGGVSVSALVLSPLSKGLFHKAISESGVALMPGFVVSKPELAFVRNHIANISGCESPEAAVVLDCLKKKTEEEIVKITANMKLPVIPACVDGVFFPKSAEEILVSKESNRVPFMTGVTNQECGYLIPKIVNITGFEEGMDKDTVLTVLQTMPLMGSIGEFLPLIMDEYFGGTNDPHEIRNRFLDLCGDFVFVIPALRTAKYHRDSDLPVYLYEFQHRPSIFDDSKPDFVKADHGDELLFVMGAPFLSKDDAVFIGHTTDKEKALSKTVMKYWANFARHGNPNGPGLAEWPKYDDDEDYLEINLKIQSAKKLKEKRFKFWTETLPREVRKIAEGTAERTEL